MSRVHAPVDNTFASVTHHASNQTTSSLNDPQYKEIALEILSTAENSTLDWTTAYTYLEDIGDGRGYTGGLVGFCSGTGDMLELVQYYNSIAPGNPLEPYTQALINVNGTASHAGLGAPFEAAWHTAATREDFRQAQQHERDRVYFDPAVTQAIADGLRALGQFMYYDASVLNGVEGMMIIRANARAVATTPAQGGTETAYLTAFANAAEAYMIQDPAHSDVSRINAQRKFISEGNFTLTPPLSWTMYGDPFSINSLPTVPGGGVVTPPPPGNTGLPANIIGEYWTNWSSPRLTAAPSYVNLFYLAFAVGNGAGNSGTVTFSPGSIGQSQMIADIDTVQARGGKVLLSIGGASDGAIRMLNSTQVTQMVNSVISIVDTYGLDGIDWDLEDLGTQTSYAMLASASDQLKAHYGASFIITCAAIPGEAIYEDLTRNGKIDALGIMFYEDNQSVASRQAQIVSMCTSLVGGGIAASKILIGNMYANGWAGANSRMEPSEYLVAYNTLKTNGITVGGAFVWSMGDEVNNSYKFATTWQVISTGGSSGGGSSGGGGTPPPPPVVGTDPWRANPNLFWNKRLPTNTPVHASSSAWLAPIVAFMRTPSAYGVQESMWPNTSGFTSPIYIVGAETPRVIVDYGGGWRDGVDIINGVRVVNGPGATEAGAYAYLNKDGGVRIPSGAQCSPASDHELSIYDTTNDTLYEFWMCLQPFESTTETEIPWKGYRHVNPTPRYQCMAAGVMPNFTTSATGRFIDTPGKQEPNGTEHFLWGTAATGLTYTGGRITPQDMNDGVIPHAIDVSLPYNLKSPNFTWPAWRADWGTAPGPSEGQRMRLPANVNLSSVTNPFARMFAIALRDYGAVINDLSGKVSIRFNSTVGYTSMGQADPWPSLFAAKGIDYGAADYYARQANVRAALATIPWEQLQFLPDGYGQNPGELLYP